MSDETTSKSGKTWLYVVGILVGLPLLYVLSIGPVTVLAERGVIPTSFYEAVYQPLEWFMTTTELNSEALNAYVKAWYQLTGTPELTIKL